MKLLRYDVAGNCLLVVIVDEKSFPTMGEHKNLATLCWLRGVRTSDGIAVCSIDRNGNWDGGFTFFNPDGSRERVCGNALMAIASHFLPPGIPRGVAELPDVSVLFDGLACYFTTGGGHSRFPAGEHGLYDTGSPHRVLDVADVRDFPLVSAGAEIQNMANLTIVAPSKGSGGKRLTARTYERGVNAETSACGTGAAAAALHYNRHTGIRQFEVEYPGGVYAVALGLAQTKQVTIALAKAEVVLLSVADLPTAALQKDFNNA